jgi:hypothetical protein
MGAIKEAGFRSATATTKQAFAVLAGDMDDADDGTDLEQVKHSA